MASCSHSGVFPNIAAHTVLALVTLSVPKGLPLKVIRSSLVLMEGTLRDTKFSGTAPRSRPRRQNGAAIKALREKDGWSQTALAQRVGIRQASLSAIESESANAHITTLNLIARAMRVPVDAIMREEDDTAAKGSAA